MLTKLRTSSKKRGSLSRLLRVPQEVSVSSVHRGEKLAGHAAREVGLRQDVEPGSAATESENQTISYEMAKPRKKTSISVITRDSSRETFPPYGIRGANAIYLGLCLNARGAVVFQWGHKLP